MKKITFIIFTLALAASQIISAQNPKWYKKVCKTQVSVLAYDKDGNMKQGQGIYVNNNYQVVTEYDLLNKADKISIITSDNKVVNATRLGGASSLYNVVKLCTDTKKMKNIPLQAPMATNGEIVYILPPPTQKGANVKKDTIINTEKFNEKYAYYKLKGGVDETMEGSPVLTEDGQLIGIVQISGNDKTRAAYVLSSNFCEDLQISAFDVKNNDMKNINLPLSLPNDEQQATTFLYLSDNTKDTHDTYTDDFIERYPQNSVGYIQQAESQVVRQLFSEAESTYEKALKSKTDKDDEIHYSFSKALYSVNTQNINSKPESWTLERALEEAQKANSIKQAPIYDAMEGFCLYALKRYNEAYDKFYSLRNTNLRSAEYFTYCAECKEKEGADKKEILALQDSALNTFKKPYTQEAANYIWLRAQTLIELKQYRDAVLDYNEYEHLMMKNLTANFYYEREQIELKSKMFEQALNDINHAVTMNPSEPLFRAEQAGVNYLGEFYDEAIISCQEAIRLDSNFAAAYRIYGMSLSKKGNKEEAKEKLQKAAELGDEIAKAKLEEEMK